jgi:imidazolonepropionase
MAKSWILRNIGELLTLKGAAAKQGRSIEEEDLSVVRRACVVVVRGKIAWVGPERSLPSEFDSNLATGFQTIDAQGKSVMPAFIECHTHSIFTGDRADEFEMRNLGCSYQEIAQSGGGILSTVKSTRRASEDDLVCLGQERLNEFARQGVSTVEIKSGYGLRSNDEYKILRAAQRLKGLRVIRTYLGPHSVPPGKTSTEYLHQILNRDLPFVAKNKLAHRADIFVEAGYFSREQGDLYMKKARQLGFQLTIHGDQLTRSGGCELAISHAALSADHLVCIGKRQISGLAKSEVTAVLLPGADFYLKMNYPPARALIAAGARVAVATDFNPGSCPSQSLSLMGVLARRYMGMSLPELIVAYTLNAGYALGLQDQIGSIEVGKAADLQMFSGSWRQLFYKVGEMGVAQVWCQGNPLL